MVGAAGVVGAGLGTVLGRSGRRRLAGEGAAVRVAPPEGTWDRVFSDDFGSGDLPSGKRWRRNRYGGDTVDAPFNPDLEAAVYDPACVSIVDGVLRLQIVRGEPVTIDGRTYPLRSGAVSTEGRFVAEDGDFVEARVRVPAGVGLWPAFWAMVPGRWPPEIDCFEFHDTSVQQRPAFNYHHAEGDISGPVQYGRPGVDHRENWHVYGWHRAAGRVVPYLDGVAYPQAGAEGVDALGHFLVLNLAVLAEPGPAGAEGTAMEIDWVRVWRPVT